jgi:hypothetical protein
VSGVASSATARRWVGSGLLLGPPDHLPWARSHAMVPTVRVHGDERVEVLFSPRDESGRARVARAWFTQLPGDPAIEPEPVLDVGPLGAFDDSGVNPSCLVQSGDRWLLYYIGWHLGVTVPFQTYIGCAVSEDGGRTFDRVQDGPLIGRSGHNPYLATSPWVAREEDGWRMWYASGRAWEATDAGPKPHYHIRHATSADGWGWDCSGPACIDFQHAGEHAIARPCVLREDGLYRMWFSHRGERYRIGYAESEDGVSWSRRAEPAPPAPSGQGWDAAMVEYPAVFDFRGRRHMLYNGDGYGRTGIGHAVLEDGIS